MKELNNMEKEHLSMNALFIWMFGIMIVGFVTVVVDFLYQSVNVLVLIGFIILVFILSPFIAYWTVIKARGEVIKNEI